MLPLLKSAKMFPNLDWGPPFAQLFVNGMTWEMINHRKHYNH